MKSCGNCKIGSEGVVRIQIETFTAEIDQWYLTHHAPYRIHVFSVLGKAQRRKKK